MDNRKRDWNRKSTYLRRGKAKEPNENGAKYTNKEPRNKKEEWMKFECK